MIPKLFHHIWASATPFKEKFAAYRESFMRLHPDWSFKFTTLDDCDSYCLSAVSYRLQKNTPDLHWIVIADIMKHEILYKYGGILLDTDNEAIRSFEGLRCHESFGGASYGKEPVGNGVYGAEPGNPLFKECAEAIVQNILKVGIDAANHEPWRVSGPEFTSRYLTRLQVILPVETFYPFRHTLLEENRLKPGETLQQKFPKSYSVHWWSGCEPDGWSKEIRQ